MSNIMHILFEEPALSRWEMQQGLENLAQQLLKSGLMRIDADPVRNFVRFQHSSLKINLTFSRRELFSKKLLARTQKKLSDAFKSKYKGPALNAKVADTITSLQNQSSNLLDATPETEQRLARILVQSAHPIVIHLLLLEETEIFITFGHDVGEMMDIQSWKKLGSSSGLQSTDGTKSNIFISCGGNPFYIAPDQHQYDAYGDGFPALARLMIIGAQELGHYADLVRNRRGRKTARHSINTKQWNLTEKVFSGRQKDHAVVDKIKSLMNHKYVTHLLELEKKFNFYKKQPRKKRTTNILRLRIRKNWGRVSRYLQKHKLSFVSSFDRFETPASHLLLMLEDMQNNLTPKHEAYKRRSKQEEEMVACIEALARVPQQAIKWGHPATRTTMSHLYKIYYGQVIPSCIKAYETLSKKTYEPIEEDKTLKVRKTLKRFYRKLPKRKST